MSINILGSNFLEINVSHIWTNPVPIMARWINNELIKCVINARMLLHTNMIDPNKYYKFFPAHGMISSDGYGHYVDNPRLSWEDEKDGCFINYDKPILSNAHPKNKKGIIIWYRWLLTGLCIKKDLFLPTIWTTTEWVKMIQYWYQPGDILVSEKIWMQVRQCNYITIGDIGIPIYDDPDGAWKSWNLIEWSRYTFECYFWDDEWYGSFLYPQYSEYLYLSWLITDADFDPKR
jgi:hypothetical protein